MPIFVRITRAFHSGVLELGSNLGGLLATGMKGAEDDPRDSRPTGTFGRPLVLIDVNLVSWTGTA